MKRRGSLVFRLCVTARQDLHVEGRHGGRLVDVTPLRVAVVDGHRRVEGGEELRCGCGEDKKDT